MNMRMGSRWGQTVDKMNRGIRQSSNRNLKNQQFGVQNIDQKIIGQKFYTQIADKVNQQQLMDQLKFDKLQIMLNPKRQKSNGKKSSPLQGKESNKKSKEENSDTSREKGNIKVQKLSEESKSLTESSLTYKSGVQVSEDSYSSPELNELQIERNSSLSSASSGKIKIPPNNRILQRMVTYPPKSRLKFQRGSLLQLEFDEKFTRAMSFRQYRRNDERENQVVMENLNNKIVNLQQESKKICEYNDDDVEKDEDASSNDSQNVPHYFTINLLISNELNNFFEVQEILQNSKDKIQMLAQDDKTKNLPKGRIQMFIYRIKTFKQQLQDLKKICCICYKKKKKRTGKELWGIVKKNYHQKKIVKNYSYKKEQFKKLTFSLQSQLRKHTMEIDMQKDQFQRALYKKEVQQDEIIDLNENEKVNICESIKRKILIIYQKFLIHPSNKKLIYFHMIVAICLFADTFLTGVTLSNQESPYTSQNQDRELGINENLLYVIICSIQTLDIILNFLKIEITPTSKVDKPFEIFQNYISGFFILDVIAVIPYSLLGSNFSKYIFLRFLKLLQFVKYLSYFTEYVLSLFSSYINNQQSKIFKSMFKLLFQIFIISHMCACLYILIGVSQYNNKIVDGYGRGWIWRLQTDGVLDNRYWSKYIAAFYWVITTFSAVGYGDVLGDTQTEYMYTMFVEMLGICFFGYIIGLFQSILQKISNTNAAAEHEDSISHWLMLMDKAVNHHSLNEYNIQNGVRTFFTNKFKHDGRFIIDSDIFIQLKPKIQNTIMDILFNRDYRKFEFVFRGCSNTFKRLIFQNCKFQQFVPSQGIQQRKYFSFKTGNDESPCIIKANQMSHGVFLILSGTVHVMDHSGQIKYCALNEGSIFGEISLLLDEPNQYSYYYDPYDKQLSVKFISDQVFLTICMQNQQDANYMKKIAIRKQKQFEIFKTQILLANMRTIVGNSKKLRRKCSGMYQMFSKKQDLVIKLFNISLYLMKMFLIQNFSYTLIRLNNCQSQINQEYMKAKKAKYVDFFLKYVSKNLFQKLMSQKLPDIDSKHKVSKKKKPFFRAQRVFLKVKNYKNTQDRAKSANTFCRKLIDTLQQNNQTALSQNSLKKEKEQSPEFRTASNENVPFNPQLIRRKGIQILNNDSSFKITSQDELRHQLVQSEFKKDNDQLNKDLNIEFNQNILEIKQSSDPELKNPDVKREQLRLRRKNVDYKSLQNLPIEWSTMQQTKPKQPKSQQQLKFEVINERNEKDFKQVQKPLLQMKKQNFIQDILKDEIQNQEIVKEQTQEDKEELKIDQVSQKEEDIKFKIVKHKDLEIKNTEANQKKQEEEKQNEVELKIEEVQKKEEEIKYEEVKINLQENKIEDFQKNEQKTKNNEVQKKVEENKDKQILKREQKTKNEPQIINLASYQQKKEQKIEKVQQKQQTQISKFSQQLEKVKMNNTQQKKQETRQEQQIQKISEQSKENSQQQMIDHQNSFNQSLEATNQLIQPNMKSLKYSKFMPQTIEEPIVEVEKAKKLNSLITKFKIKKQVKAINVSKNIGQNLFEGGDKQEENPLNAFLAQRKRKSQEVIQKLFPKLTIKTKYQVQSDSNSIKTNDHIAEDSKEINNSQYKSEMEHDLENKEIVQTIYERTQQEINSQLRDYFQICRKVSQYNEKVQCNGSHHVKDSLISESLQELKSETSRSYQSSIDSIKNENVFLEQKEESNDCKGCEIDTMIKFIQNFINEYINFSTINQNVMNKLQMDQDDQDIYVRQFKKIDSILTARKQYKENDMKEKMSDSEIDQKVYENNVADILDDQFIVQDFTLYPSYSTRRQVHTNQIFKDIHKKGIGQINQLIDQNFQSIDQQINAAIDGRKDIQQFNQENMQESEDNRSKMAQSLQS